VRSALAVTDITLTITLIMALTFEEPSDVTIQDPSESEPARHAMNCAVLPAGANILSIENNWVTQFGFVCSSLSALVQITFSTSGNVYGRRDSMLVQMMPRFYHGFLEKERKGKITHHPAANG